MTVPVLKAYTIWSSALVAYQDWRERQRALREVARLDARDRSRVLGDIGMTSPDFATAMRFAFASRILLPEAFRSVGVDYDKFEARHPEWNQDMRRTCMLCPERRRCSDRLKDSSFETTYAEFCPNARSLEELGSVQ
ncbi:hypothetical protein IG197_33455 (plasmid) [Aminobacter sp. SR38]|jgi:uncharacterized protein YjiS (DUF1127 family)|uniref:hypothetical protein n=1 Tax=Aminobacter sp. SR38 TaxID=2774562 RepID=UPI00178470AF|nr:hypothetical protein [Aminobacter sp. SR38]QOF75599.1 hypothetical protein IG197_33455 [Aminobacter sp. SR38]